MKTKALQRGATLLISLIMLVILTLFAVSAINLSSVNLKIVGNMQAQKEMEAAGDEAIQQVIGDIAFFNDAVNGTGTWASGAATTTVMTNGIAVVVAKPVCVSTVAGAGYSALTAVSPEDNIYEVVSTAANAVTGASVTTVQGIKISMPAGSCP